MPVAEALKRPRGERSPAAAPPSGSATSAADENQIAPELALQIFADYHASGDALAWLEHTREEFEYYLRRLAMVEQRHARLRSHLSRSRASALVRDLRAEGVRGLTATITRLRRPLPHAEGRELVFHYLYYFSQSDEAARVREIDCWSGLTLARHAGPGPTMPPPPALRFMTSAEYDLRALAAACRLFSAVAAPVVERRVAIEALDKRTEFVERRVLNQCDIAAC